MSRMRCRVSLEPMCVEPDCLQPPSGTLCMNDHLLSEPNAAVSSFSRMRKPIHTRSDGLWRVSPAVSGRAKIHLYTVI